MNNIIDIMPDLSVVVKINESMPFEQLQPFIDDAISNHLSYYVGSSLVTMVTSATVLTDPIKALQPMMRRVVGPMAIALATPELSLRIGDSGITVQKTDTLLPASDAKIAAYVRGSIERSYKALDTLINYLETHQANYPEWANSPQCSVLRDGYIRSAAQFQDEGLVDINRSPLTFQKLIPIIRRISRDVHNYIDPALDSRLRAASDLSNIERELRQMIIIYIASSSAAIYSSSPLPKDASDYRPAITPLIIASSDSVSYFTAESLKLQTEILDYVKTNAVALGLPAPAAYEDYNKQENHIFSAIS